MIKVSQFLALIFQEKEKENLKELFSFTFVTSTKEVKRDGPFTFAGCLNKPRVSVSVNNFVVKSMLGGR